MQRYSSEFLTLQYFHSDTYMYNDYGTPSSTSILGENHLILPQLSPGNLFLATPGPDTKVSGISAHPGTQISSTDVFRMGLQQQSELVRAHREFFRNINYSSPSLQNRLLGSQYSTKPPGSLSPKQNCCSLVTPKPFGPLFQTRRSHKFPENHVAFISPVMKYTVTDYRLLPQIYTPPRTLGPDLSSDDYKQKVSGPSLLLHFQPLILYNEMKINDSVVHVCGLI
ncbi:unnamed protein product [Dicrocoelium dendriticum]|nr:unnamed protein product [Dicrocoelium dendriticum]